MYVVDARTALVTPAPIDIDWDTIAEPPAKAPRPESKLEPGNGEVDVEARFPVEDIEAVSVQDEASAGVAGYMEGRDDTVPLAFSFLISTNPPQIRRFSIRANVLPVLTHADALTTKELHAVRHAVSRDLSVVFGRDPLGTWGILSAGPVSTHRQTQANKQDMDMDEEDPQSDRISLDSSRSKKPNVPFAVFAPEPGPGFTRAFRWGRADAGDADHSDLAAIRDAFVTSADWLRTSTREVVYEKFRTEKLLSARGVHGPI